MIAPGGVFALAQDGARIAWFDCVEKSTRLNVGTPGGPYTRIDVASTLPAFCGTGVGLALGGDRLLWAFDYGGNNRQIVVFTASLIDRRPLRVGTAFLGAGGYGEFFGGVAGDGATLAFTRVAVSRLDEVDEAAGAACVTSEEIPCRYRVFGGRTATVAGGSSRTLVTRGASVIAAGGRLVALARPGGLTGVPNTADSGVIGPCACTYTPRWSPDGTRLAFASGAETDGASLYVSDAAGRQSVRITRGSFFDLHPTWSPDGEFIAFHRVPVRADHKIMHPVIYVVRADGTGLRRLGPGRDPSWSHDGSRIAFARDEARNAGIYTMSPSGAAVRALVHSNTFGWFRSPTWSADDRQLAYLSQACTACVYLVAATGTGARKVMTKQPGLHSVEWSNDGGSLLLSGERGMVVRGFQSGVETRLLPSYRGSFGTWSPDDRRVVLTRWTGGAVEVFALTRATRALQRLSTSRRRAPHVPVEVRRAADGRLVASIEPLGDVRALAVSANRLAALVVNKPRTSLQIYSLPAGRLLRTLRVGFAAAGNSWNSRGRAQLSISGSILVYNVGRAIRALEMRTGSTSTLATARALPVGLSIEGDRVLWAENFGLGFDAQGNATGRGEIRSLTLGD